MQREVDLDPSQQLPSCRRTSTFATAGHVKSSLPSPIGSHSGASELRYMHAKLTKVNAHWSPRQYMHSQRGCDSVWKAQILDARNADAAESLPSRCLTSKHAPPRTRPAFISPAESCLASSALLPLTNPEHPPCRQKPQQAKRPPPRPQCSSARSCPASPSTSSRRRT